MFLRGDMSMVGRKANLNTEMNLKYKNGFKLNSFPSEHMKKIFRMVTHIWDVFMLCKVFSNHYK